MEFSKGVNVKLEQTVDHASFLNAKGIDARVERKKKKATTLSYD